MSDYMKALMADRQYTVAIRICEGEDPKEIGVGVMSTSEAICVALAANRYDLLPEGWPDPLDAFLRRLDGRQRDIVRLARDIYAPFEGDPTQG